MGTATFTPPTWLEFILVLSAACWLISQCLGEAVETTRPTTASPPPQATNEVRVIVRGFRFEGNRHFSARALGEVVQGYTNRFLSEWDLEAARQELNRFFNDQGYRTSGALLPNQTVTNATVRFDIVEGQPPEVHVHGTRALRETWVRKRVAFGAGEPLNLPRLHNALYALQQNPNLRRLTADLQPGRNEQGWPVPGASVLDVHVEEARPYYLALQAGNYRPVSVGAEVFEIVAGHHNLTRHGDTLELDYGLLQRSEDGLNFSGLDNLGVSYRIPVTAADTAVGGFYERRNYTVIEAPFDELDIDSDYSAWGLRLEQPVLRGARRELTLGLSFERRQSESTLLGVPFSFSRGSLNGEADVSVVRLAAEGVLRGLEQSLAFRLTTTLGLDVLEITKDGTERDGEFVSLLGQVQYSRRLWQETNQVAFGAGRLAVRGGFQWANEPLLAIEQLSIGGHATVRGYRENQLVRDRGVFGTIELQATVLHDRRGRDLLQIYPFFDVGAGWDYDPLPGQVEDIASVGLGARLDVGGKFYARVDWGYAFRDLVTDHENLQDYGVSFSLGYSVF